MSKPKKKRTKKYHPGRPKFPAWTLDTLGPLKELDFERLETAVKLDLGLIKMGTMDRRCYGNILYALRHFYSFSQNFENQAENELLATMGTAAVHTLLNLAEEVEAGKPKRPAVVAAMLEPLEHALATYFSMMRVLHRSEQEYARREAQRCSLTNALQEVAVGGIAFVMPDSTDGDRIVCGVTGVAYVHGRCEVGHLERKDRQSFWVIPEKETLIRITKPTLFFLVEKWEEKDQKK